MTKTIFIFLVISFVFCSHFAPAAQNPFAGSGKDQKMQKTGEDASFFQPVLLLITKLQKELKKKLTDLGRDMRLNPYGHSFWLFLAFSFAYGMIHALGPGHGKSVVCFYFLSRPGSLLQGLFAGALIPFIHVSSAVAIILTVYFFLDLTKIATFEGVSANLQQLSYFLIMLIGLFLAARAIYELKSGKLPAKNDGPKIKDFKGLAIISLAAGLIPCPGAAIILIFAITLNILTPGLIAMLCLALGMSVTTTFFALLSIVSRKAVFRFTDKGQKAFSICYAFLAVTGSLTIAILGGLLLMDQM
jgi:nickel/cobalt transporter (NicO) family protein